MIISEFQCFSIPVFHYSSVQVFQYQYFGLVYHSVARSRDQRLISMATSERITQYSHFLRAEAKSIKTRKREGIQELGCVGILLNTLLSCLDINNWRERELLTWCFGISISVQSCKKGRSGRYLCFSDVF